MLETNSQNHKQTDHIYNKITQTSKQLVLINTVINKGP